MTAVSKTPQQMTVRPDARKLRTHAAGMLLIAVVAALTMSGCAPSDGQANVSGGESATPSATGTDPAAQGYDYQADADAWIRVRAATGCDEDGCVQVSVISENCASPVVSVIGRSDGDSGVLWDQRKVLGPLFPGDEGSVDVSYAHPTTGWVEATILRCDGG